MKYGEKAMDKALFDYQTLYCDVGFMWHISAGANYRLTGNAESKNRNLVAAAALASRYNTDAGFIRAWNGERAVGWAIYGFILSYIHTGKQKYLDAAKKTAHYFIAAAAVDGYISKCDFRQPDDPDIIDCSAGTIAVCGLIEIAKVVP